MGHGGTVACPNTGRRVPCGPGPDAGRASQSIVSSRLRTWRWELWRRRRLQASLRTGLIQSLHNVISSRRGELSRLERRIDDDRRSRRDPSSSSPTTTRRWSGPPASGRPRSRATSRSPAGIRSWSRSGVGFFTATSPDAATGSDAKNPIAGTGQSAARCDPSASRYRARRRRGGPRARWREGARPRATAGSRLRLRSRRPRAVDPVRGRRRSAGRANGARPRRPDLDLGSL